MKDTFFIETDKLYNKLNAVNKAIEVLTTGLSVSERSEVVGELYAIRDSIENDIFILESEKKMETELT